jgi:hypothetical protein
VALESVGPNIGQDLGKPFIVANRCPPFRERLFAGFLAEKKGFGGGH